MSAFSNSDYAGIFVTADGRVVDALCRMAAISTIV